MEEYFNKKSLIKLLREENHYGYLDMLDLLTLEDEGDFIRIVRCKDCVYFDQQCGAAGYCKNPNCVDDAVVFIDGFCYRGIEKEDD